MYFALLDGEVVNPLIIAQPSLDAIRGQITFTDLDLSPWEVLDPSPELFRVLYHFGIPMRNPILERNILEIQNDLRIAWVNTQVLGMLQKASNADQNHQI